MVNPVQVQLSINGVSQLIRYRSLLLESAPHTYMQEHLRGLFVDLLCVFNHSWSHLVKSEKLQVAMQPLQRMPLDRNTTYRINHQQKPA